MFQSIDVGRGPMQPNPVFASSLVDSHHHQPLLQSTCISTPYHNTCHLVHHATETSLHPTEQRSEELLQRLEETGRVPSREKFRRMICNTFVATGACPYGDRCVFLHDYRLRSEATDVRPTRQTRNSNLTKDTFYWPDMVRKDTSRFLDAQGLPDANQRYTIPAAFASPHSSFHNRGLYSMWGHFVGFCIQSNEQRRDNALRDDDELLADDPYNRLLPGRKRLSIFVDLSNGRTVLRQETNKISRSFDHKSCAMDHGLLTESQFLFTEMQQTNSEQFTASPNCSMVEQAPDLVHCTIATAESTQLQDTISMNVAASFINCSISPISRCGADTPFGDFDETFDLAPQGDADERATMNNYWGKYSCPCTYSTRDTLLNAGCTGPDALSDCENESASQVANIAREVEQMRASGSEVLTSIENISPIGRKGDIYESYSLIITPAPQMEISSERRVNLFEEELDVDKKSSLSPSRSRTDTRRQRRRGTRGAARKVVFKPK